MANKTQLASVFYNTALDLCVQFLLQSLKGWPRVCVAGFHSKKSSTLNTVRPKTVL